MFKGGQPNPYDEIVNKTTDENLTSENWELILNLCDKVQDEGQEGAHNVIAAVLKRLAHRNPNVQLYALSLAEALSKNCTIELHREIASRAFTQGLEKIITDRTTHEKVKRRALGLIAEWTAEFENDPTLGVMEDCYNNLKSKNFKFEVPQEAPPPTVDADVRRREEEELQRVLEMSMQDKGGRNQWQYSAASSSGAGGSGSQPRAAQPSTSTSYSAPQRAPSISAPDLAPPSYSAGYVRAQTPPPKAQSPIAAMPSGTPPATTISSETTSPPASEPVAPMSAASNITVVTRVRALHTFEPTEPGELAFEKGDIIKVVDRGYKDWWRGQLKGRTGIFPVNYVEPMPEPTAAELAKEAEKEAAVFAQAANVDRLLSMLRSLDPAKDNLADNEEIQELYRSSMTLRPKIVKLIDKYSQKRADLVSMNETFVRAKGIFDRMMEESLARHTGVYESQPPFRTPQYQGADARARPEYANSPAPQPYGWNTASYDQSAYFPAPASYPTGSEGTYPAQTSQYVDPAAYAQLQQKQALYSQAYVQAAYGPQGPTPYGPQTQQPLHPEVAVAPQLQSQPQPQPQQQSQQQSQQPQPQHQPQHQPQSQLPQLQANPQHQAQVTQQQQPQATAQQQPGPPYVFDPNGTYSDPNAQAWARYYAQGGKDLAGAVYFIAIPGVTDGVAQPGASPTQSSQPATAAQIVQQQQQPQPSTELSTSGEVVGHASQQTQSGSVPQARPPIQTTQPVNGHGNPGPTSPYATNVPWAQATTSPPSSPTQPNPVTPYHQSTTSGSPPPSTFSAQGTMALQSVPLQSQLPLTGPYSEPGPENTSPAHVRSGSDSLEATGESSVSAYPQYNSLPSQFGGMKVGEDGNHQSLHTGQQQAPQGVGMPA